jgi:(R,R)-butanediol dehydrogenase / meso-butanediol dehydrogenase / diacetyl reductase
VTNTMRAVRYHGNRDVRVDEIPEPECRPGFVKIAPEWCGICGSDVHEYLVGPETIPSAGAPHPITGETVPIVLGHEYAGTVVEVGEGVVGVSVGDKVAVEPIIRDNDCPSCVDGRYNLCRQLGFHGLSGYGGGLSEFSVVPDYMVHVLPDNVPTDVAALIEPLAVGWHAAKLAELGGGESVLIVGAGPIGLVTLLAAKALGAGKVAMVELTEARKAKAAELGADLVLDPSVDDIEARLATEFGQGVDVAFDAGGNAATIALALESVRPRGRVVNIALWEHPVEFDMFSMLFKESNLTASCAYCNDHAEVIAAIADGTIDVSPLITARIPFEEIVTGGIEELMNNRDAHVKILVHP